MADLFDEFGVDPGTEAGAPDLFDEFGVDPTYAQDIQAYRDQGGGMMSGLQQGLLGLQQSLVGATGGLSMGDFESRYLPPDAPRTGQPTSEQRLREIEASRQALPQHPTMGRAVAAADRAPGLLEGIGAFAKEVYDSPDTSGFLLNQAAQLAPQLATFGGGAALARPVAGAIGGLAGSSAQLGAAGFLSSVANTYGPNVAEALDKGKDFDQAQARATLQSVAQGGIDALTAAVIPWKIGPNQWVNVPAQTAVQMAGGAGGEALRSAVVGEQAGQGEMAAEAILEALGLPGEVAGHLLTRTPQVPPAPEVAPEVAPEAQPVPPGPFEQANLAVLDMQRRIEEGNFERLKALQSQAIGNIGKAGSVDEAIRAASEAMNLASPARTTPAPVPAPAATAPAETSIPMTATEATDGRIQSRSNVVRSGDMRVQASTPIAGGLLGSAMPFDVASLGQVGETQAEAARSFEQGPRRQLGQGPLEGAQVAPGMPSGSESRGLYRPTVQTSPELAAAQAERDAVERRAMEEEAAYLRAQTPGNPLMAGLLAPVREQMRVNRRTDRTLAQGVPGEGRPPYRAGVGQGAPYPSRLLRPEKDIPARVAEPGAIARPDDRPPVPAEQQQRTRYELLRQRGGPYNDTEKAFMRMYERDQPAKPVPQVQTAPGYRYRQPEPERRVLAKGVPGEGRPTYRGGTGQGQEYPSRLLRPERPVPTQEERERTRYQALLQKPGKTAAERAFVADYRRRLDAQRTRDRQAMEALPRSLEVPGAAQPRLSTGPIQTVESRARPKTGESYAPQERQQRQDGQPEYPRDEEGGLSPEAGRGGVTGAAATQPETAETPVITTRDGTPFKSRNAAIRARAKQARQRPEVAQWQPAEQDGGWVLKPQEQANEAQAQAETVLSAEPPAASAPKETPKQRYQREAKVNSAEDDLLAAIAKLGGLNRDEAEAQGIDPADFARRGWKIKRVFTKGGRSFDDLAETLAEDGYPVSDERGPGANALLDALDKALRGNKVHTPTGAVARIEQESAEREADIEAEEASRRAAMDEDPFNPEFAEPIDAEWLIEDDYADDADIMDRRAYELAEALDVLERGAGEALLERAAIAETPDADLIAQLEAALNERRRQERSQEGAQADEEAQGRGPAGEVPVLESYTEEDVTRREAEAKAAADQARKEQEAAERKAQADRERGDFELTGSDLPADRFGSRMGDMFGARATVTTPPETAPAVATQKPLGPWKRTKGTYRNTWRDIDVTAEGVESGDYGVFKTPAGSYVATHKNKSIAERVTIRGAKNAVEMHWATGATRPHDITNEPAGMSGERQGLIPDESHQPSAGSNETIDPGQIRDKARRSVTPRAQGTTLDALTTAIRDALRPAAYRRLTDSGRLNLVATEAELPAHVRGDQDKRHSVDGGIQGAYADGSIYLVAENISPGRERAVLLHEASVHALRLGKDDAEFQGILNSLDRLAERDPVAAAAMDRVPTDTAPEHVAEERLAYLIEDAAARDRPAVKRLLGRLVTWLREKLRGWGLVGEYTENDLLRSAERALGNLEQGQTAESGALFSRVTDPAAQDIIQDDRSLMAVVRQIVGDKVSDTRPVWLGALTRQQVVDVGKDVVPRARAFERESQRMDADRTEHQTVAAELANRWLKLIRGNRAEGEELANLMHDATLAGTDPEQGEGSASLLRRWEALSDEAKSIYQAVREAYQQRSNEMQQALMDRVERSGASDAQKAKMADTIRVHFESARVQGPYFPLARFGDYWVRAEKDGAEPEFLMTETQSEQRAEMKRLRAEGYAVSFGKGMKNLRAAKGPAPGWVRDMSAVVDNLASGEQADLIKDGLYQLYLESLPELSVRKNFIHRKGRQGFSKDALRAFAHQMFHGSHQLARLNHGDILADQLEAMREDAKTASDPNKAADIVKELDKRLEWAMNPTGAAWANNATSLGFVWYLGITPAAALVNMTQVPIVAGPVLGAKHGFVKAQSALGKAGVDYMASRFNQARKDTIYAEFDGDLGRAIQTAEKDGILDKTLAHSLAGVSETEATIYQPVKQRAMEVISKLFHEAEKLNRETTFIAAYRLARESGQGHKDAAVYAADSVFESQFDYSGANRARFMQNNTAKVLLQFRQYSQNATYLLWRNLHQSLKGESAEVKSEARKKLVGVLGMTGLFAGAAGMPLMSVMMGMADIAHDLFGDEDEPWDAELEWRNFLADMFGKEAGAIIAKGPMNALTGMDISGRASLDNLWLRSPNRELEAKALAGYWLEQAAGPVVGIGINAARGIDLMGEGQVYRGAEAMVPKVVKDVLRGLRYGTEGAQTLRGDHLADMSAWDAIMQTAGFTPAALGERYDENSALKRVEQSILNRRQRLIAGYAMAHKLGDQEAMNRALENIRKFNAKNRTVPIDKQSLVRSIRSRQRYSERAEDGMVYNRRLQQQILAQRFVQVD